MKAKIFLFKNIILYSVLGFAISALICLGTTHSLTNSWEIITIVTGYSGLGMGLFGGIIQLYRKDDGKDEQKGGNLY